MPSDAPVAVQTPPTDRPVLLRATWVAPMAGPLVRDGAVTFDGSRIAAVGPADELTCRYPDADADAHDLGPAVILPGLVNAHVHLELSDLRPGNRPRQFTDWLLRVMRDAAPPTDAGRERVAAATQAGIRECLRFGVTTVGDITRWPGVTRAALRESPLRAVSFGEVTGMAARVGQVDGMLAAAADPSTAAANVRIGVEPHAPYSLDLVGYRRCVEAAARAGLPVTTHLAETPDEAAFLARHAGPFRELWDALGGWADGVSRAAGGPIRAMRDVGLLDRPALLAHVNYCDDAELDLLAESGASVAYCPRTHAWFGHPPHRWRDMLARGVNVAVGTDSRASAPDLNLVDDLRLLRRLAPDVPAATLWELATTRAARAIGMGDQVGALVPGRVADCVVLPVPERSSDPLATVLDEPVAPLAVWVGGVRLDVGRQ